MLFLNLFKEKYLKICVLIWIRKEAEAKKKEREDISKEIAASREEHQQDRIDQKKKLDQKRMGKARAEREE